MQYLMMILSYLFVKSQAVIDFRCVLNSLTLLSWNVLKISIKALSIDCVTWEDVTQDQSARYTSLQKK
uniref:Uncharacterized protein n=1 Tax=Arion vulgaris TaxID=1028688 RepID=A0A0B7B7X1_9EUPU